MTKKRKRISPLWLAVCIFLAAVLAFGGVFTAIAVRRNRSYAVRYGSVGADAGTLNYLALSYKRSMLSTLRASGAETAVPVGDTDAFWESDAGEGKTYRDRLIEGTRNYVADLLIAASLYSRATSLSREEKKTIEGLVDEVVSYKANGSKETYEKAVAACGFTLSDVKKAVTLQYEAKQSASVLYGVDGSGIRTETEHLSSFLQGYTHISLFYVDEEDSASLAAVRSAIAGTADTQISPEQFEILRDRYDTSDDVTVTEGFYFREGSEYTRIYAGIYPETVKTALSMTPGEYRECETAKGICFLRCYEVTPNAYSMDANKSFFTDFYALAANARYAELLASLRTDVAFADSYDAQALAALPYNDFYPYYVRY